MWNEEHLEINEQSSSSCFWDHMGKVMSNQSFDLMSMFGPQGHHRGEPKLWL